MSSDRAWARSIGRKIRQCRLARNLTQAELADGLFSKSYISQLENGTVNPSLRALRLLAKRLGVSHLWLLEMSSSPAAQLLKRATAHFFLGEALDAKRLLEQAAAYNDALTDRDRIEALLLKARLAAHQEDWEVVVAACAELAAHLDALQAYAQRYIVPHRYLWGKGWLRRGNQRQAILHWEVALAALRAPESLWAPEALHLLVEAASLYAALGDLEASRHAREQARAVAAQLAGKGELGRLALRAASQANPLAALPGDDAAWEGAVQAEAWARAHALVKAAAEVRRAWPATPAPPSGSSADRSLESEWDRSGKESQGRR